MSFMEEGHKAYAAALYFCARDNKVYDQSIFHQWIKKKNDIRCVAAMAKRILGAGQKPELEDIEDLLADKIICLCLEKLKVTRSFIRQGHCKWQLMQTLQISRLVGTGQHCFSYGTTSA